MSTQWNYSFSPVHNRTSYDYGNTQEYREEKKEIREKLADLEERARLKRDSGDVWDE